MTEKMKGYVLYNTVSDKFVESITPGPDNIFASYVWADSTNFTFPKSIVEGGSASEERFLVDQLYGFMGGHAGCEIVPCVYKVTGIDPVTKRTILEIIEIDFMCTIPFGDILENMPAESSTIQNSTSTTATSFSTPNPVVTPPLMTVDPAEERGDWSTFVLWKGCVALLGTFLFIAMLSGCASTPDQVGRLALTGVDAYQTSKISENPCLEESNPTGRAMMGKQPSNEAVILYFIGWYTADIYIEKALKARGAPKWVQGTYRVVSDALRAGTVQNNQYWHTDIWNDPQLNHTMCN